MTQMERWKGTAVRVVGAGAIGRGLATALAASGIRVQLYTRFPEAHAPGDARGGDAAGDARGGGSGGGGVDVRALAALAGDAREALAPVVLCLSAPERELVAAELARGVAEVPRAAVARASVEALLRDLPFDGLGFGPVLVVTNPVELVCELVARRVPVPVLGFGMATDRERIVEALERGFGIPDPGASLGVTGMHGRRAIPALAGVDGLLARIAQESVPAIVGRLGASRGPYESASGRAAAVFRQLVADGQHAPHELVHAAVRAITAAEFDGARPPVARPVARLAAQVAAWLGGKPELAPEVSAPVEALGPRCFVGGRLTARGFALPILSWDERELLGREEAAHRAQVAELLGGAR